MLEFLFYTMSTCEDRYLRIMFKLINRTGVGTLMFFSRKLWVNVLNYTIPHKITVLDRNVHTVWSALLKHTLIGVKKSFPCSVNKQHKHLGEKPTTFLTSYCSVRVLILKIILRKLQVNQQCLPTVFLQRVQQGTCQCTGFLWTCKNSTDSLCLGFIA